MMTSGMKLIPIYENESPASALVGVKTVTIAPKQLPLAVADGPINDVTMTAMTINTNLVRTRVDSTSTLRPNPPPRPIDPQP